MPPLSPGPPRNIRPAATRLSISSAHALRAAVRRPRTGVPGRDHVPPARRRRRGGRHPRDAPRRPSPPAGQCCTCTASPTTSSTPSTPSGGPSAATTSTPSTCASTGGRCATTRPPTTSSDLREYFAELDAAWWRVTERDGTPGHHRPRHSTGGLTLPLWANDRRPAELTGMVLNSPWFDMQGSRVAAHPAGPVAIERIGRPAADAGDPPHGSTASTPQSCTATTSGEFDYDLDWKPSSPDRVYAGWLRAIRRGHAELHRGLDIAAPRWCCRRRAPRSPTRWTTTCTPTTSCSTSQQIRRWASSLGTSRHLRRRRRCPPRRRAVPARGARAGRTTRSTAGCAAYVE